MVSLELSVIIVRIVERKEHRSSEDEFDTPSNSV
jgi:hypothetical protein